MPRAVRAILILIPAGLAAAAVGMWIYNAFRAPADPPPPDAMVFTKSIGGIAIEVEYHKSDESGLFTAIGPDAFRFRRKVDILDFDGSLLTFNELGLSDLKAGDTVRWNFSGPVLRNGQPMEPHPLQPRSIQADYIDLTWDAQPSPYPRDTLSIAWAGSTRILIAAHGDGAIRLWDADKNEVLRTITPESPKTNGKGGYGLRIAVSPDGKQIAATNLFGEEVTVWDSDKGTKTATFGEPKGKVTQVAFADDKTLLEARGGKLRLRALSGTPATEVGTVHEQFDATFAIHAKAGLAAWSDGKKLHFGPIQAAVFEKDATSGGCFAFSTEGSLLAAFDGDNRLSLLDPKTGKDVRRLRWRGKLTSTDGINALAFSPDGKTLAVGGSDSIRLYDVPTGRERGGLASPWVRSLAWSADGRTLAAGLRYLPGLRLWNTTDLVAKTASL